MQVVWASVLQPAVFLLYSQSDLFGQCKKLWPTIQDRDNLILTYKMYNTDDSSNTCTTSKSTSLQGYKRRWITIVRPDVLYLLIRIVLLSIFISYDDVVWLSIRLHKISIKNANTSRSSYDLQEWAKHKLHSKLLKAPEMKTCKAIQKRNILIVFRTINKKIRKHKIKQSYPMPISRQ